MRAERRVCGSVPNWERATRARMTANFTGSLLDEETWPWKCSFCRCGACP